MHGCIYIDPEVSLRRQGSIQGWFLWVTGYWLVCAEEVVLMVVIRLNV